MKLKSKKSCHLDVLVQEFLKQHLDRSRPVLLGLSGGADSLALFHLLLRYRDRWGLDLHIAHVDHRWRSESALEAAQIQSWGQQLNLPVHIKVLQDGKPTHNAEDIARQARLAFFDLVCEETGGQAVMLGHHADDLAETVLKRLFESAAVTRVCGLRPVSDVEGIVLWRPLLKAQKRELLTFLQNHEVTYFEDSTNCDPKYLRTRLRNDLLPQLSTAFGKDISAGLCSLGEECEDICDYLDERTRVYLEQGLEVDLSGCKYEVEVKHVLRQLCRRAGFSLSREALKDACQQVLAGSFKKQFMTGRHSVLVHGGKVKIQ
ncbi:MAG: tRNA lysidine(34) synthetase TilS [Chlamydiales bacterium]|nr:tRNA lysidine(34) synthetase TilS [Chlamydiales bacterium]